MANLYEQELIGKSEAENRSLDWGWFISGMIFGFFAIPFVWLIEIKSDGPGYKNLNTNTERQAYFSGYQRVVKKKRLLAVILGWATWILGVLFFISILGI